jgi:catechol 2,3-dioxygenase-like lactoylglutathione lyase family enzyme
MDMNTLNSCKMIAFVPTANIARAKEFYKYTLGFHLVEEGPFGLMFEVSTSLLRITNVQQVFPTHYTVMGWKVPNIAAAVDELAQKGIKFDRYEGFDQDERGVWTAPDGAKVAWFRDPDRNILSMTQFPSAVIEELKKEAKDG